MIWFAGPQSHKHIVYNCFHFSFLIKNIIKSFNLILRLVLVNCKFLIIFNNSVCWLPMVCRVFCRKFSFIQKPDDGTFSNKSKSLLNERCQFFVFLSSFFLTRLSAVVIVFIKHTFQLTESLFVCPENEIRQRRARFCANWKQPKVQEPNFERPHCFLLVPLTFEQFNQFLLPLSVWNLLLQFQWIFVFACAIISRPNLFTFLLFLMFLFFKPRARQSLLNLWWSLERPKFSLSPAINDFVALLSVLVAAFS